MLRTAVVCTVTLLLACGGDEDDGEFGTWEEGGTGDAGTLTGDAGTDAGTGTTAGTDDGGTATTGGGDPDEGTYASDIAIDAVEINQAAGIALASGGTLVPQSSRVAPVIGGRPALVRVMWTLDAAFVPRSIVGRLTLTRTDGTTARFEDTMNISGAPSWDSIDGAFAFELDGEDLQDGDEFTVGLFEADEGLPGAAGALPRIPATGTESLAVVGQTMEVKIVILPANDSAISGTYTMPDNVKSMLETDLYNSYPVNALSVEYHAPITVPCGDAVYVLDQVSGYRNSEGAAGNVYYQAVYPESHNNACGSGGFAWLVGDGMGDDRVSMSVNHPGDAPNNVAHELGHNNGREHSWNDPGYLPSSATSSDCGRRSTWGWPAMPGQHPQADSWGFAPMYTLDNWLIAPTEGLALTDFCEGHADFDTYGPAMNDVMSYAFPYWVSAHNYNAFAARVATLSSWDGAAVQPDSLTLHAVAFDDGTVSWRARRGSVVAPPVPGDAQPSAWVTTDTGSRRATAYPKVDGSGITRGFVVPNADHLDAVAVTLRGHEYTLAGAKLWSVLDTAR